jgi:transcriptional regulator with XRE-family HTH domain
LPNDPIDTHVGLRIRQRRALLGMSQTSLSQAVGLTFQQIQKYEKGRNRTSASMLYEFAKILDVPVAYFFEGSPTDGTIKPPRSKSRTARNNESDISTKRETLELVRAYYKIRNNSVREHIYKLIKAVADG